MERRLKAFERKPWACSLSEIPWKDHGCTHASLEYILYRSCGEFFDGHRAAEDCLAGIHVLATPTCHGTLPLTLLLESARQATVRIWACDSPFEMKDVLKGRGYRWSDGKEGRHRAWYRELTESLAEAECGWLATEVYAGREPRFRTDRLTAKVRYSNRA